MSPLPGTRMIPRGWSAHHAPVVLGAMNALAVITDPARTTPGQWDEEAGAHGAPTPYVVAGGPADPRPGWRAGVPLRLQQLDTDREVDQAEQTIALHRYLAQFPKDLPDIQVGYVVSFTDVINDPHLARALDTLAPDTRVTGDTILAVDGRPGMSMAVIDELHGSEMFTRDLILEHNQQPEGD